MSADQTSGGTGFDQSLYCNGSASVSAGRSGFTNGITIPVAGTYAVTIASPANGATFTGSKVIIKGAVDTTTQVNSVLVKVTTPTDTEGTSYLAKVNDKYFAAEVQLSSGADTV